MNRPDVYIQSDIDFPRLLLASNREPFRVIRDANGEVSRCERSMGGLTSALCPVLERCDGVWVSWNPNALSTDDDDLIREQHGDGIPFPTIQVGLRKSEIKGYYNGFCNRALWPLCHTVLRCVTPRLDYWQDFRTVNDRFADVIASRSKKYDVLWIHDYHLMLVPAAMRRRIDPRHRIGYFHHVPFPNVRVLKAFPWHRQLIKGILGADAIGFHTPEYASNFIECCQELLGCDTRSEPGTIHHGKYGTIVRVRPIGVDAQSFAMIANQRDVQDDAIQIRRKIRCERLVLSVDRLDYTKGILERVEAIRALFARIPQCRGIVTFVQVAVPTRTDVPEYPQYRAKVEAAIDELNGEFGHGDWKPFIYRTEPMKRRELVAHYLAADVACITPLADGMNLVASEYCASRTDGDGVLVLSSQAGAATTLGEHAVCVDMRKQEGVVTGILRALTMSESERALRMGRLRSIVMKNTTDTWLKSCLDDIMHPEPADAEQLAALVKIGHARQGHDGGRIRAGAPKSRHATHSSSVAKRAPAGNAPPH
jgi:alpha,alpha-trehalose-phosphate synthase [UDP-forming]